MMPWPKPVCTALQAVGLSAGHKRENHPHYPPEARSCAALLHGQQQWSIFHTSLHWASHSTDTWLLRAESWPPNHCTKATGLGWLLSPASPGHATMIPETEGSISQPQARFHSALCPVDVSIKQMIHAPVNRHYTKQQLEAQRAKFAAKDTNDSVWLLWKQLLWVVRNGCRHRRAWQWWQITQYASSVCAWYE